MKTSPRQEELLRELVSCRGFLMQQLEDLAEEEGRPREKLGWKWLRENRKYPTPRSVRGKKDCYWGWSFTRSLNVDLCNGSTQPEKKVHASQISLWVATHKTGPSILPYETAGAYVSRAAVRTEEEALLVAAVGMGNFLKRLSGVPTPDDEQLEMDYFRVMLEQTEQEATYPED